MQYRLLNNISCLREPSYQQCCVSYSIKPIVNLNPSHCKPSTWFKKENYGDIAVYEIETLGVSVAGL